MATNLSPDIYGIAEYVNNIKKEFITGVNEETLMLGIFGYLGEVESQNMQNAIIMASEFSNESVPTRAKFEKNIIAHALGLGIEDINAIPAQMEVLLTFVEEDIIAWHNSIHPDKEDDGWEFTLDKNTKFYFGDFEFHTDYDIIIRKIPITTQGTLQKYAYTAQFSQEDLDRGNQVSDINNPYLTPPVRMNLGGMNAIFVKTTLRQVEKSTTYTKVLSDNDIAAKMITFTFEGQLAAFDLKVTEGNNTPMYLIPVYEGLNKDTKGKPYFWYQFLDSNTIRIKFDKNSYVPKVNATVEINLQTTQGANGNFTYNPKDGFPQFTLESDRLGYSNIVCQVRPVNDESIMGSNKKTIAELKKIIPVEALARGSITTHTDLENFFNSLDSDYSKMYFYKKRDNCLERLYHGFLIMKNDMNIIPTNTLNLRVRPEELEFDETTGRYLIRQGRALILSDSTNLAHLLPEGDPLPSEDPDNYDGSFEYYLPYDFTVIKSPRYGVYTQSTIHATKDLGFYYINEDCLFQYIATNILWDRNCLEDHDKYRLTIQLQQNIVDINTEITDAPLHKNEEGNLVTDLDVYMIVYDKNKSPLRWAKATPLVDTYDGEQSTIEYQFEFSTKDKIDNDNRIRIMTGLYDIGSNNESYAALEHNTMARIFVVSNQGAELGLGIPPVSTWIPGLEGKSLSNTYDINEGLDWFYDYSSIVRSTVEATIDENAQTWYTIENVPVIKYGYFDSETTAKAFFKELVSRKVYIDKAIDYLEDAFEIDFKFFNTYGPSKFFTWDGNTELVDRVNVSLIFKLKLKPNYDTNVVDDIKADIKEYVEDINNIKDLHIPNLITLITNTYRDYLVYFEFVSINGKSADYQHIYTMEVPDGLMVPEFVNINTLKNSVPDITISLV